MFITAKIASIFISSSAYHIQIFTVIYSPLDWFLWNQNNDQLPFGMLAQLVRHWLPIPSKKIIKKIASLLSLNMEAILVINTCSEFFFSGLILLIKLCLLLRRLLPYSFLYPQFTYMIYICSQSLFTLFLVELHSKPNKGLSYEVLNGVNR